MGLSLLVHKCPANYLFIYFLKLKPHISLPWSNVILLFNFKKKLLIDVWHWQMPVSGQSNGHPLHHPGRGKSLDDSEPFLSTNKLTSRSRGLPENNLLKSFSSDKERANSVAKIKVVVCPFKSCFSFSVSSHAVQGMAALDFTKYCIPESTWLSVLFSLFAVEMLVVNFFFFKCRYARDH